MGGKQVNVTRAPQSFLPASLWLFDDLTLQFFITIVTEVPNEFTSVDGCTEWLGTIESSVMKQQRSSASGGPRYTDWNKTLCDVTRRTFSQSSGLGTKELRNDWVSIKVEYNILFNND